MARWVRRLLALAGLVASAACIKIVIREPERPPVVSEPTPTPTATPTPQPQPTPEPTQSAPTPTPSPTLPPVPVPTVPPVAPTPEPAICGGVPAEPVPLPPGPCRAGFVPVSVPLDVPEAPERTWCVAQTSCPEGTVLGENSRCWALDGCQPLADMAQGHVGGGYRYVIRKGMFCEPGYGRGDPDADRRGCVDAYGRQVQGDGDWYIVSDWTYHGYCPPLAARPCVTPTPGPTPEPSRECGLGKMPHCGAPESPEGSKVYGCCDGNDDWNPFAAEIRDSIAVVVRDHASWFRDGRLVPLDGSLDEAIERYRDAIVAQLRKRGLCAEASGSFDEIAVKNSNAVNVQYDILLGDDQVDRGSSDKFHVASVCRPARF